MSHTFPTIHIHRQGLFHRHRMSKTSPQNTGLVNHRLNIGVAVKNKCHRRFISTIIIAQGGRAWLGMSRSLSSPPQEGRHFHWRDRYRIIRLLLGCQWDCWDVSSHWGHHHQGEGGVWMPKNWLFTVKSREGFSSETAHRIMSLGRYMVEGDRMYWTTHQIKTRPLSFHFMSLNRYRSQPTFI